MVNFGPQTRSVGNSRRRFINQRSESGVMARKNSVFCCPNPNCRSTFVWKRNLLSHLRYQCGQAPKFKCPYCEYKCIARPGVRRHIKLKHKNHDVYVLDMSQPWVAVP